MSTEIATRTQDSALMEQVLVGGDLSKLSAAQRLEYYRLVCESMGLNPLSKPFDYITLNNRLTLYAKKDATDQLRNRRGVSIVRLERERLEDVYTVTAYAALPDGRQDSSLGAVSIAGLKGDALANAMMKAETKSKRRVTLSICGLGWLDETEVETVHDARPVVVDMQTGEIAGDRKPPSTAASTTQPTPQSNPKHRAALLQRYAELLARANELGLEPEPINPATATDEEIIAAGRALGTAIGLELKRVDVTGGGQ